MDVATQCTSLTEFREALKESPELSQIICSRCSRSSHQTEEKTIRSIWHHVLISRQKKRKIIQPLNLNHAHLYICKYISPLFPNILINSALLKFIIDINHSEKKYLTSNNGLEFIGKKSFCMLASECAFFFSCLPFLLQSSFGEIK